MVRPAAAPWRSVPYPPPDGEREGSTDPSRFVGAAAPPLLMFPVLGLIQLYPSTHHVPQGCSQQCTVPSFPTPPLTVATVTASVKVGPRRVTLCG